MGSNAWQYVQAILYLEDLLSCILLILSHLFYASVFIFGEDCSIVLLNHENVLIVWTQDFFFAVVGGWPLIIVKLVIEYMTLQQRCHFNTFFNQRWKDLEEEIATDKRVLVLDHILNHNINRPHLVTSQCRFNC